jgi:hypothetical protein
MASVPAQPPLPGPYDEDFEAPPDSAWSVEMRWAEKGQYQPLSDSIRAGKPIADDDWEVREFLADYLASKIRRSKKRPPDYVEWTFGNVGPNFPDDFVTIKKHFKPRCDMAQWLWKYEEEFGVSRAEALEKARKEFKLSEKGLEELAAWLNMSSKRRRELAVLK